MSSVPLRWCGQTTSTFRMMSLSSALNGSFSSKTSTKSVLLTLHREMASYANLEDSLFYEDNIPSVLFSQHLKVAGLVRSQALSSEKPIMNVPSILLKHQSVIGSERDDLFLAASPLMSPDNMPSVAFSPYLLNIDLLDEITAENRLRSWRQPMHAIGIIKRRRKKRKRHKIRKRRKRDREKLRHLKDKLK